MVRLHGWRLPADYLAISWQDPDTEPDLYRNRFTALRSHIPWRALTQDDHGRYLHPRPTVQGTQTAIVVGDGQPTHTDRDHRVRVQFHWQRGSAAARRNRMESWVAFISNNVIGQ